MLFNTTDQLVAYLPVDINFEFSRIKPLIQSVENLYIKDILGPTQYEALNAAFTAENLSAELTKLLPYCQEAVAYLAFEKYIPIGNVNISDSGIHIKTNENTKQAFNWQVDDVRRSLEEEGFNKLQLLLQFLWSNSSDYNDWSNSSNAPKHRKHFINSADDFNQYVDIKNSFRTYWILKPSINKVEQLQIQPVLNKLAATKFADMQTAISSGSTFTGSDLTAYNYAQAAIAHLAAAHAAQVQAIELSSFGVSQKSVEGLEMLHTRKPANDFAYGFIHANNADGNAYLSLLADFIDNENGVTDDDDETTDGVNDSDHGIYLFM